MKSIAAFFITFLVFFTDINAQNPICVQSGTNPPIFENDLQKAITIAKSGDYVYIPGGVFSTSTSPLIINKKLYIIGAGYHPDSSKASGITTITTNIVFDPGSKGSLITGLDMKTQNLDIKDSAITVVRNNINNVYLRQNICSDVKISENVINNNLQFVDYFIHPNFVADKNVIFGTVGSFNGSFILRNNVFLYSSANHTFNAVSNGLIENNIFFHGDYNKVYFGCYNLSVTNNLYVSDSIVQNWGIYSSTFTDNIYKEAPTDIFVNYNGTRPWNKTHDFHLKSGSKGISAGTDGKDIGIYGTSEPFKDGGNPFNPRFVNVSIPGATNSNGQLLITITIEGQDR